MHPDDLKHWISQGLGRPYLYFKSHDLTPYRELLLEMCLYDWIYDWQSETPRAAYLYEIFQGSDSEGWLVDRILEALAQPDEDMYDAQLFDLAVIFARQGNPKARAVMYRRFLEEDTEDGYTVGASQLVELDGVDGLIFVLEHRQNEFDGWYGEYLWSLLEEREDYPSIQAQLTDLQAAHPVLTGYLERVKAWKEGSLQRSTEWAAARPDFEGLSYAELQEAMSLVTAGSMTYFIDVRRWRDRAPEAELMLAAEDLLASLEVDPPEPWVWKLMVFGKHPFPLDPQPLFRLVDHSHPAVVQRALPLLAQLDHPEIRQIGLRMLAEDYSRGALELFVKHYQKGDEALFLAGLKQLTDDDEVHAVGFALTDIVQANLLPCMEPVLLELYEREPCSVCRAGIIERLLEIGPLPEWMVAECRHDANPDIRELVV